MSLFLSDSSVGATADVWFQTDKLYTIQEEYLDVPADLAAPEKFIGYAQMTRFAMFTMHEPHWLDG